MAQDRTIAEKLQINTKTIRQTLSEEMRSPHRLDIATDLLSNKRIITGDKTWRCQYNPQTKRPSVQ